MRKTISTNEILFIDARNLGHLINRRTKELSEEDIQKVSNSYHKWKSEDDGYEDVKGFCKTVTTEEVAKLDYVLTPGRYVGLEETEDNFDFKERFTSLQAELKKQMQEEDELNKKIIDNLAKIKVNE